MHADLSRWIFQPDRHYSRVVVQQGRVSLDSDANAQASILLHYLRALAADLIGEFGGPSGNAGFAITTGPIGPDATLSIGTRPLLRRRSALRGRGRTGRRPSTTSSSPTATAPCPPAHDSRAPYLVWLKVWERFISAVEDPDLREIALGLNGPDTTGRTRMVWQVLASPWPQDVQFPAKNAQEFYGDDSWAQLQPACSARAHRDADGPGRRAAAVARRLHPVARAPATGGRRTSSTGWRSTGTARPRPRPPDARPAPTFMWSRDNGSVILPITSIRRQHRCRSPPSAGTRSSASTSATTWRSSTTPTPRRGTPGPSPGTPSRCTW